MDFSDQRSPFVCSMPNFSLGFLNVRQRPQLVYGAGLVFALSWWVFIDAIVASHLLVDNPSLPGAEDYAVGSIATLGMAIVNAVDPALIKGDSFAYSGSGVAWKARLILFFGITCNAGALFGAVTIAIIKYYMASSPASYVAGSLMFQSVGILISCIMLWSAQAMDGDGVYNIVLN